MRNTFHAEKDHMRSSLAAAAFGVLACWALVGCSPTALPGRHAAARAPEIPPSAYQLSGEPTSRTPAVAVPDRGDVASATAAVNAQLRSPERVTGEIATQTLNWQVPTQWWTAHRVKPYKVVSLRWSAPQGGFDWGWAVVAQARPDSPWSVIASGAAF